MPSQKRSKSATKQRLESVSTQSLGSNGATISHYKIQQHPSAFQFTCFTEGDMEALYGGKKTMTRRKLMKQKRLEQQQSEEKQRKQTKKATKKEKKDVDAPIGVETANESKIQTRAGKTYILRNGEGKSDATDQKSNDSDVQVVSASYANLASYSMGGATSGAPEKSAPNGRTAAAPHVPPQPYPPGYGAPPPHHPSYPHQPYYSAHYPHPSHHQLSAPLNRRLQMRKRSYDDTFYQEYQDSMYQQEYFGEDGHAPQPPPPHGHYPPHAPPPHHYSPYYPPHHPSSYAGAWQRSKSVPTIDERQVAYLREHYPLPHDSSGAPTPPRPPTNGTPPVIPPPHIKNLHTQNVSTVYDRRLRRRLSLTEECDPEEPYPTAYASGRRYSEDVSAHHRPHSPSYPPGPPTYGSTVSGTPPPTDPYHHHQHHHLRRASMPGSTLAYSHHHIGSQPYPSPAYPHMEQRRLSVSSLIGPGFRDISLNGLGGHTSAEKSHEEWFRQYKRGVPHVDETLQNDLANFKFGAAPSSDADESAEGVVEIKFEDDPDLASPRTVDTLPSDEVYEGARGAREESITGDDTDALQAGAAHEAMASRRRRSGVIPDLNPPPPETDDENTEDDDDDYEPDPEVRAPPKLPGVHELFGTQ